MVFEQSGIETYEAFRAALGEKPLGIFIRSIVGMDRNAAKEAFADFLSNGVLSSVQQEFINQIIDQLSQNGIIEPSILFEPPFTKYHESGVAGVFPKEAARIIQTVESSTNNAKAG
jgi:type I restriction enzyme, R subunit